MWHKQGILSRWRNDDKAPEDATTVEEAVSIFRTARRPPSSA
jgi:hypothetical protein